MRTYDFSPLFRSSVGFDRVFDLLENAAHVQAADNWPPYDIEKSGEDHYRVTMAVAGFTTDELDIVLERNLLVVRGNKRRDEGEGQYQYLYSGIAKRPFTHRFELADHVKVANARFENGILTIDLVRELPEEMKPRRIEIGGEPAVSGRRKSQIEQKAA